MSVLLGDAGPAPDMDWLICRIRWPMFFVGSTIGIGASSSLTEQMSMFHCSGTARDSAVFKHHVLDIVCQLSDVEATDQEIKNKSDAWQVAQRVTLRRSNSAEDCCLFKGETSLQNRQQNLTHPMDLWYSHHVWLSKDSKVPQLYCSGLWMHIWKHLLQAPLNNTIINSHCLCVLGDSCQQVAVTGAMWSSSSATAVRSNPIAWKNMGWTCLGIQVDVHHAFARSRMSTGRPNGWWARIGDAL